MERSDPHLLRFYNKLARAKLERAREPFSTKVLSLCIGPEKKYVSSFWVMLIEWQGNFFKAFLANFPLSFMKCLIDSTTFYLHCYWAIYLLSFFSLFIDRKIQVFDSI